VAVFDRAGSRNIAYNATFLRGGHRLGSRLGRLRMLWIGVSNLAATMVSLGLLRPGPPSVLALHRRAYGFRRRRLAR
jgi:uncharacterized membrane protein YjgN (DUF898 family)